MKLKSALGNIGDRITKDVKLILESLTIIVLEITKCVSYVVLVWKDTKEIYSWFKEVVKKVKKILWGK